MIFRTGSVLIVGMCEEYILNCIYNFIKNLLKEEYKYICQGLIIGKYNMLKDKKKKIRKKQIIIMDAESVVEYHETIIEKIEYIDIIPKKRSYTKKTK